MPELGSQIHGAVPRDNPPFPPPRPRPRPPFCRRTPGSLTVSQERQQRGKEQQYCRTHGVGCSRAPGRGRGGRARGSAGRGRGGPSRVRSGKGSGAAAAVTSSRQNQHHGQRLASVPGIAAPGLGAGAREELLTVKSHAKAQKTQRREDRLPRCRQLRGSTALLTWAHGPLPSALPTPSQVCHPHSHSQPAKRVGF